MSSAERGTAPSFQLYAFDLMVKLDYRMMTLAERGLLLSMWCECWANGEIPSSSAELSCLLGKESAEVLTPRVLSFFEKSDSGLLRSPFLEQYRADVLERRKVLSDNGSKGGKKRAENERKSREASSPASSRPSQISQASLKPAESGSEIESGSGTASTGSGINCESLDASSAEFVMAMEEEERRLYVCK